jgi:hypothetical protein
MVVHYFNLLGAKFSPTETNSPLVVDTQTVLTCPIAFECLKPIPRGHAKINQLFSRIQSDKLSPRHPQQRSGKALRSKPLKNGKR